MLRIAAVAPCRALAALARLTLVTTLALCLGLAFMPLGCESSGGMGRGEGTDRAIHQGGEGPAVPDVTVSALRACAEHGRDRLKESTYAFQFEVTEGGRGYSTAQRSLSRCRICSAL
jgi:hypothetical protein